MRDAGETSLHLRTRFLVALVALKLASPVLNPIMNEKTLRSAQWADLDPNRERSEPKFGWPCRPSPHEVIKGNILETYGQPFLPEDVVLGSCGQKRKF